MVGGQKASHLDGKITALTLASEETEETEKTEDAYPFDFGFSLNFLLMRQKTPSCKGEDVWLTKMATNIDTSILRNDHGQSLHDLLMLESANGVSLSRLLYQGNKLKERIHCASISDGNFRLHFTPQSPELDPLAHLNN